MEKNISNILSHILNSDEIKKSLNPDQIVLLKLADEKGYFEGKIGLKELTEAYNKELIPLKAYTTLFILKNYEKFFGNKLPSCVRKELNLEGKEI